MIAPRDLVVLAVVGLTAGCGDTPTPELHDGLPIEALARTVWIEEFDISADGERDAGVQVGSRRHVRHLDGADGGRRGHADHVDARAGDAASVQSRRTVDRLRSG